MKLSFKTKEDPLKKIQIDHSFNHDDFSIIEGDSIFKLAARAILWENQDEENRIHISLKYQVLSKETAFTGFIKQDKKNLGEIKKVLIEQSNIKKLAQVVAQT